MKDNISQTKVYLINMGYASRYIDEERCMHIKCEETDTFRGNLIFGNLN